MHTIQTYFANLPNGTITDHNAVIQLLTEYWDQISNSGLSKMHAEKLHRIENLNWNCPFLTFDIERHPSLMSSRFPIQRWTIDIEGMSADFVEKGYRQNTPRAKRLNVKPLAESVLDIILNKIDDERVTWKNEKHEVRVNIGIVIPDDSYQQTVSDRRRRFRKLLDPKLLENGWESYRPHHYKKIV